MSLSPDPQPGPLSELQTWARHEHHAYADGEDRPLGSYLAISSVYAAAVAAAGLVVKASGAGLPERFAARDLALLAIGTHKAARLLTKDPVTSPLRAPFTRFRGSAGESEVQEEVRGTGAHHAVGELVTCPFCVGQWLATGAVFGLVLAPRTTRFVASLLTVLSGSDFLQLAYAAAQERSD